MDCTGLWEGPSNSLCWNLKKALKTEIFLQARACHWPCRPEDKLVFPPTRRVYPWTAIKCTQNQYKTMEQTVASVHDKACLSFEIIGDLSDRLNFWSAEGALKLTRQTHRHLSRQTQHALSASRRTQTVINNTNSKNKLQTKRHRDNRWHIKTPTLDLNAVLRHCPRTSVVLAGSAWGAWWCQGQVATANAGSLLQSAKFRSSLLRAHHLSEMSTVNFPSDSPSPKVQCKSPKFTTWRQKWGVKCEDAELAHNPGQGGHWRWRPRRKKIDD